MILDLGVMVIVIGTMIQGYRSGLLQAFVRTAGWLIAMVCGFIFQPRFNEFIRKETDFYESFYMNINEKISGSLSAGQVESNLPSILQDPASKFSEALSNSASSAVTDLIFSIVCFLIVILLVQAVLHLVISLFSKERNDGLTGFFDGCAGMFFGFIKGIVYTFVILALMVPLASLAEPSVMTFILDNLAESRIASELYNNNLILLIIGDFL